MQVLPKHPITQAIGQLAKEAKTMTFHPTSSEGMEGFQANNVSVSSHPSFN